MSQRAAALEALISRVAAIRKADGFATDAGLSVMVGESPDLGPDDPVDVVAIVPLDTEPQGNRMLETWPIEIHALTHAKGQALLAAMAVHGDIVKAVELEDRTLGGLVKGIEIGPQRTLLRRPGSDTVGVVQLYRLSCSRTWGHA